LNELNKAFPPDNLYKGYHLIAVDGSEMQIPLDFSDPDTLHKSASKGKFLSAFHLNVSYDVLNHRYLEFKDFVRKKMAEGGVIKITKSAGIFICQP